MFCCTSILFVNCSKQKSISAVDHNQLYALVYADEYKDSLAESLKPSYQKAMRLQNSHSTRLFQDSVLSELRWTRDSVSFFSLSHKLADYAKSTYDLDILARSYNHTGMYYHNNKVMDSAFYYYLKTENIYHQLSDTLKIAETQFYQARLLVEQGLYMEGEAKVLSSLALLRNYKSNAVPFEGYQLLALCLMERGDYAAGEMYFKKALELMLADVGHYKVLEKNQLELVLSMLYANLSEVTYGLHKYEEAREYAIKGMDMMANQSYLMIESFLKCNLAQANFQLTKSEKYVDKVIESYKNDSILNHTFRMNYVSMRIADIYLQLDKKDKALLWADKAYINGVITDNKLFVRDALEFILTNKGTDDKKEIINLIKLNNEISYADNLIHNSFSRIEYETKSLEIENNSLRDTIYVTLIISILIIVILVIRSYSLKLKSKNREIQFVIDQQKVNENIYRLIIEKNTLISKVKSEVKSKIAKDLHDGIVNGIFMVRFNLQQLATSDDTLREHLLKELMELEKSTRDISHSLVQSELFNEVSFTTLIKDFITLQINKWDTKFIVNKEDEVDLDALSVYDKVNVYFLIKEAVLNVNEYSKASLCSISIKEANRGGIRFSVKDNGEGYDVYRVKEGTGLRSMRERATFLRTDLIVDSNNKDYTEVSFIVNNSFN